MAMYRWPKTEPVPSPQEDLPVERTVAPMAELALDTPSPPKTFRVSFMDAIDPVMVVADRYMGGALDGITFLLGDEGVAWFAGSAVRSVVEMRSAPPAIDMLKDAARVLELSEEIARDVLKPTPDAAFLNLHPDERRAWDKARDGIAPSPSLYGFPLRVAEIPLLSPKTETVPEPMPETHPVTLEFLGVHWYGSPYSVVHAKHAGTPRYVVVANTPFLQSPGNTFPSNAPGVKGVYAALEVARAWCVSLNDAAKDTVPTPAAPTKPDAPETTIEVTENLGGGGQAGAVQILVGRFTSTRRPVFLVINADEWRLVRGDKFAIACFPKGLYAVCDSSRDATEAAARAPNPVK